MNDVVWLLGVPALFLAAIAFYFLPSLLGWNHRQFRAIFALNALLGWTIIGWVAALVWSQIETNP